MNLFQALLMDLGCLIFPKTFKPMRRRYNRHMDENDALLEATSGSINDDLERAMAETLPTFRHHHDQNRARRGL
ncbi:MAG: hypothetical protein AAB402_04255 [Patescibacteria group bacterium]